MKQLLNTLYAVLILLGLSSCEKWLDVKPDDEVFIEEALVDKKGFSQALAGIYSGLGKPEMYGGNLKYGMLDAMAGYWQLGVTNDLYEVSRYNFKEIRTQRRIDSVWNAFYNNIRQCNLILEHVDAIRDDSDYELIKGEAIGLRAYLHLEAFKLFGPVVSVNGLDTKSLPYYKTASKVPQRFLTSAEFLNEVEMDLQEAKILLSEDPIITGGREANLNTGSQLSYTSLLDRRGARMNYYAIKALLARKSQWAGQIAEASLRAQELISELNNNPRQVVRFMLSSEIANNFVEKDVRYSKENILGLYVNDLEVYTRKFFDEDYRNNNTALKAEYDGFLRNLYTTGTGSSTDYRLVYWNIGSLEFTKYSFPSNVPDPQHFYYEVQLINLPEMYFIIAEDYLDKDLSRAIDYINSVRVVRNLTPLVFDNTTTSDRVKLYLIDEVRREYIGEGYLFTFFKRLNNPIYRIGSNVNPSESIFKLPIPNDEILYNVNENN